MEDYWARSGGLLAEWPLSTSGGVLGPVNHFANGPPDGGPGGAAPGVPDPDVM